MGEILHSSHSLTAAYLFIFTLLTFATLTIQHFVRHSKWEIRRFLPEAAATIAFTASISAIIRFTGGYSAASNDSSQSILVEDIHGQVEEFDPSFLGFSSSVFYFLFLPPILFNSGYHLKRSLMYSNFGGILSLSIIGTTISIIIVTVGLQLSSIFGWATSVHLSFMEYIAFAALISSTDPVATLSIYSERKVDPTLFYLVFGESCLNDAVALTIFTVACTYIGKSLSMQDIGYFIGKFIIIFIGSGTIGYIFGIMTAYVFRIIRFNRHQSITAVSVFLCAVYMPFFCTEIIGFSGIVAILFSGISSRRYVNKNLHKSTVLAASFLFKLVSHCAETACFTLLGLSVFAQTFDMFKLDMIVVTTVLTFIGRLHVYPLLAMVNMYRLKSQLSDKMSALPSLCIADGAVSNQHGGYGLVERNGSAKDTTNNTTVDQDEACRNNNDQQSPLHDAGTITTAIAASSSNQNSTVVTNLSSQLPRTVLSTATIDVLSKPQPLIISTNIMHMVYFAGMKGAVAYSCANIFPNINGNKGYVVSTTVAIVLLTVFIQGGLTDTMLHCLNIPVNVNYLERERQQKELHNKQLQEQTQSISSNISKNKRTYEAVQPVDIESSSLDRSALATTTNIDKTNNSATTAVLSSCFSCLLSFDDFEKRYIYPLVLIQRHPQQQQQRPQPQLQQKQQQQQVPRSILKKYSQYSNSRQRPSKYTKNNKSGQMGIQNDDIIDHRNDSGTPTSKALSAFQNLDNGGNKTYATATTYFPRRLCINDDDDEAFFSNINQNAGNKNNNIEHNQSNASNSSWSYKRPLQERQSYPDWATSSGGGSFEGSHSSDEESDAISVDNDNGSDSGDFNGSFKDDEDGGAYHNSYRGNGNTDDSAMSTVLETIAEDNTTNNPLHQIQSISNQESVSLVTSTADAPSFSDLLNEADNKETTNTTAIITVPLIHDTATESMNTITAFSAAVVEDEKKVEEEESMVCISNRKSSSPNLEQANTNSSGSKSTLVEISPNDDKNARNDKSCNEITRDSSGKSKISPIVEIPREYLSFCEMDTDKPYRERQFTVDSMSEPKSHRLSQSQSYTPDTDTPSPDHIMTQPKYTF